MHFRESIMPLSFTDAFNIDKDLFDSLGAFDPILDIDSKLFVDPALLEVTSCPEFKGSRKEIEQYFLNIIVLLKHSSSPNDRFWKKADQLLNFIEIKGTCLGYSEKGTDGNGIGQQLRTQVLHSVEQLVRAGAQDPILFELLGVFEERIGCDRISDLIVFKLIDRLISYTERIAKECDFSGPTIVYRNSVLPKSPYSSQPVLLLPKEVLHPLPLAKRYEDISVVCRENERVRNNVNKWFNFEDGAIPTKDDIFRHMCNDPEFRDAILDSYKNASAIPYDFLRDSFGEMCWYEQGKALARNNPIDIPRNVSLAEIVKTIIGQFKKLVEQNGAWELLFQEDRITPRTERTSQHLFSAVADLYCQINDIDLSPEVNSGNGPVDFKFSHGYCNKVLVELKLSRNPQLMHCLDKQIPIYMKQENTEKAIYLLINVGNDKAVKAFSEKYYALDSVTREKIELMIVDAKPKESASKV